MRRRTRRLALAGVLVVAAGAGAAGGLAWESRDRGPTPSRAAADRPCRRPYVTLLPTRPASEPDVAVDVVAHVDQPTALAFSPDGATGVLGEREGRILLVEDGEVTGTVVLDLTGATQTEGDGGLLGLAFSPDGDWLYAYRTTSENHEAVTAFPVVGGRPVHEGAVEIIGIDHPPSEQHHGGGFAFGPDGLLYIGTGDGGGLGDPNGNAQDPGELLGKVLRIDPTPDGPEPYRIPPENPFAGDPDGRGEIWALGLRNPFRLSFDDDTGDLWIGDVGQSCWEELNRLPAAGGGGGGANLGWDHREGTDAFEGGRVAGGSIEPVHAYAHRGGWCAIVAGFVVRGTGTDLDGWLLHTDYCRGRMMALHPTASPSGGPALLDLGLRFDAPVAVVAGTGGEPWVLSLDGPVYRLRIG